ncbi:hypothetical protein PIB30_055664 [Stylosanthes scabra]|uniref:Uncharacterized protein n=1 Tax=Stylosanthes scabra TaxID=79078 RepID=A0ABU6XIY0_9FABA|nr:hypothetical protein [Stylosanthes scabra]
MNYTAALAILCCLFIYRVKEAEGANTKLCFEKNGDFKILQVADMHFADAKSTPTSCLLKRKGTMAAMRRPRALARRFSSLQSYARLGWQRNFSNKMNAGD